MSDEELVSVFVTASTRRVRRIADGFGIAAFALIGLGLLGAATIAPEVGVVAGLGGTLLLPALYVSRRAAHLTRPLTSLLSAPTRVRAAEIRRMTSRGVLEESLKVTTGEGTASYPVATYAANIVEDTPRLVVAGVTAEALRAAVLRRAGLPA